MNLSSRYQVVLLEPGGADLSTKLLATLRKRVADLGLSFDEHLEFFGESDFKRVDYRAPVVGVYFGGGRRTQDATEAVRELRRRAVFVLPVVRSLEDYMNLVPELLHDVNGARLDEAGDPELESIAARLLEELHLLRSRRLVFVSYRRNDSSGVAEQLYRAFDERAFGVFLDTHSVQQGREFQSILWDRIADADLLVLLDTKNAVSSRWVAEELARAHTLGLGVMQLIWPNNERTRGTEFCEPVYLAAEDFEGSQPQPDRTARLVEAKLGEIVTFAEAMRARSLAARRTRIVGEFCTRAALAGFDFTIQPGQHIDLRPPTRAGERSLLLRIFPVVGHPDSSQLHESSDSCGRPSMDGVLLYDAIGMWRRKAKHLAWLNQYLPLKSLPMIEVDRWLEGMR